MSVPPGGCGGFRSALERALRAGPGAGGTHALAWHEHLLGCADCQALLRSEQALDEILSSLPAPSLPPDLAARVLLRLQRERVMSFDGLDRLLDSSPPPTAPAGLGQRILSGLHASRLDQRLDALLDLAPAPLPPRGLAARVLAALEPRRRVPEPFTLLRGGRRWAAAAALVLMLGAALVWQRTRDASGEPAPVEEDLLVQLEVLENWDVLMSADLDLYLASLDPVGWTLLELEADEAEADEDEG